MGRSPGDPGGEAHWFRVLTLNAHQGLHAGRRRDALLRMRDLLRRSGAEIVFLQEVGAEAGAVPAVQQFEVLADGVWTEHAYGRNAVVAGGHHGNAILSKYPITAWRNVDASVGRSERRGLLHAVIELPRGLGPLHAICVHLALRESHRRRQVARLLELVADDVPAGLPLVVAGDFNDWRGRAHDALAGAAGFAEVHASRAGRPARSFPALAPVLRLDRIYLRNARHRPLPMLAREWWRWSDHVPVAAEFAPLATGG